MDRRFDQSWTDRYFGPNWRVRQAQRRSLAAFGSLSMFGFLMLFGSNHRQEHLWLLAHTLQVELVSLETPGVDGISLFSYSNEWLCL